MLDLTGIDRNHPGYLRYCLFSECRVTFNVLDMETGTAERGWMQFRRVVSGYVCPVHALLVADGRHLPRWLTVPGQRSAIGITCSCGLWEWRPRNPPATQGEHQEKYVDHLRELGAEVAR